MSKIIKIALILIGSGILLCILAAVLTHGDWTRFNSKGNDLVSKSYESGTDISELVLEENAQSVIVKVADTDTISIEYFDDPTTPMYEITEQNGKLAFRHVGNGPFKLVNIDFTDRTSVITIPRDYAGKLEVGISAGSLEADDITVSELQVGTSAGSIELRNVTCTGNVDIGNTSGSVEFLNLEAGGDIDIANTTGSIEGSIVGSKDDYSISSETTAGSCNLENSTGGKHKLTAATTAGSIDITFTK